MHEQQPPGRPETAERHRAEGQAGRREHDPDVLQRALQGRPPRRATVTCAQRVFKGWLMTHSRSSPNTPGDVATSPKQLNLGNKHKLRERERLSHQPNSFASHSQAEQEASGRLSLW